MNVKAQKFNLAIRKHHKSRPYIKPDNSCDAIFEYKRTGKKHSEEARSSSSIRIASLTILQANTYFGDISDIIQSRFGLEVLDVNKI